MIIINEIQEIKRLDYRFLIIMIIIINELQEIEWLKYRFFNNNNNNNNNNNIMNFRILNYEDIDF